MQLWNLSGFVSKCLTIAATTAALTTTAYAGSGPQRDPVGETAHYKVDRASARTSSLIRSGEMDATVTMALPNHPDGPAYETRIDYDFVIQFVGRRTGSEIVEAPAEYFTPEFMAELRRTGQYQTPQFKVRHLGYAHARNMDGNVYSNCDKIEIYDIQQMAGEEAGIVAIARQLLTVKGSAGTASEFEDMVILAHVKEGLPVLGAAKLDVSGVYEGVRVKAGADFEAP